MSLLSKTFRISHSVRGLTPDFSVTTLERGAKYCSSVSHSMVSRTLRLSFRVHHRSICVLPWPRMPITAILMRSLAPITEAYDLALSPKLPIAIPAVPKTLCLINSRLFVIVLDLCVQDLVQCRMLRHNIFERVVIGSVHHP